EHFHRRDVAVAARANAAAVRIDHLDVRRAGYAWRHGELDAVVVDHVDAGGGGAAEADGGQLAHFGPAVERDSLHESRAGHGDGAAAAGGSGGGQHRLHFHFGDGDSA